MDIRCGSCNKLFRVSDDKITGKGIKFACTRCGNYVKITRGDFENYILSQNAAAATDIFESQAKPPAPHMPWPEAPKTEEPALSEPSPFEEPPRYSEPPPATEMEFPQQPAQEELRPEPQNEPVFEDQSESLQEMKPGQQAEPYAEPAHEAVSKPVQASLQEEEVQAQSETQPGPLPAPVQEPRPEPMPESPPEPKISAEQEPFLEPASPTAVEPKQVSDPRQTAAETTASVAPPVTPAAAKKESVRPAATAPPMSVIGAAPASPPRSRSVVVVIALIVLGLAGFGVFRYLRPPSPPATESAPAMISIDGLQILNAAGSIDPNGDLIITGTVENATDKERSAWYIIVDVLDAQGAVMHKIRLLNGEQLYTRSDYDIMANRGVNVQELKAGTLQDKGVVIPPKGSVAFEMRYLQPPAGIASFSAALQSFDPVRLSREIAEEAK